MHCLEIFIGIAHCSETCEDLLKEFLLTEGLGLSGLAQVRSVPVLRTPHPPGIPVSLCINPWSWMAGHPLMINSNV